jgi:hypothetical protein
MMGGQPPQYPQQPGYQQPGQYPQQPGQYPQQPGQYPPGAGYGPAPKNNGMAIASLVLGILWLCSVGSILAVIFGYMAKKQIKESGGAEQGDGMATAGIVLGWIGIAFLILYLIGLAVGFATFEFQTS